MDILGLPYTLFADIMSLLPAMDVLVCRRTSRAFHEVLTRSELCETLILLHYPRSREGRRLLRLRRMSEREQGHSHGHVGGEQDEQGDWAAAFARLTRRYGHLALALPWRIEKLATTSSEDAPWLRGVTPWERILRLDARTAKFQHGDPAWTLSAEDGLLVYPPAGHPIAPTYRPFRLRHLDSGTEIEVPFDIEDCRVVRRVRLRCGILVLEWCEQEDGRHFATAYDVKRTKTRRRSFACGEGRLAGGEGRQDIEGGEEACPWVATFRSEWEIVSSGLDLVNSRFYSTHNATHYAIYIWQQPHMTGVRPREQLVVWELGAPSPYRPTLDLPTLDLMGDNWPSEDGEDGEDEEGKKEKKGPRVIRRLGQEQLAAWGVRQGNTPKLAGLALDAETRDAATGEACGHIFVHAEDHRWLAGPHSGDNPPRLHSVRSTGIPLVGDGPRWVDDCGSRGNPEGDAAQEGRAAMCWRRRDRRLSARSAAELDGDGDDVAAETWPGRAPCWRHDDFPYLTVSEMYDAAAGVRVSARHCFMLAAQSASVRHKLRIEGMAGFQERTWGGRTKGRCGTAVEGPNGDEMQFDDEMWSELLGGGHIAGDERRLVGEDDEGQITVAHFE
jgi:hypothetical protein